MSEHGRIEMLAPCLIARTNIREADDGLVESIRENGLLHPPTVYHAADGGGFRLIAGGRRVAAWEALYGRDTPMPVYVIKLPEGRPVGLLQLVENLHRRDLAPTTRAKAFRALLAGGMSKPDIARLIECDPTYITHVVSLLDLIPPLAQAVDSNILSASAGEEIARLPAEVQTQYATQLLGARTVRNVAAIVNHAQAQMDRAQAQVDQAQSDADDALLAAHGIAPLQMSLSPGEDGDYPMLGSATATLRMALDLLALLTVDDPQLTEARRLLSDLAARWLAPKEET